MKALVERYLTVRKATGFGMANAGYLLRDFAAYCQACRLRQVRRTAAVEWASRAPSREQRERRLDAVRLLAVFAAAEDPRHEIPPRGVFGGQRRRPPPRIFTDPEIHALLEATARLRLPPPVASGLRTLLGLLACTGLRIGEACRLKRRDLTDDGCLVIRQTKFKKTRLVPLHPTAQAALARHLRSRGPLPLEAPVFVSLRGRALCPHGVRLLFLRACAEAAIGGRPKLHGLRHTFAVRALERCAADRAAVDRHALALTTYLGHSRVADTYWYLEATPRLLAGICAANERCLAKEVRR